MPAVRRRRRNGVTYIDTPYIVYMLGDDEIAEDLHVLSIRAKRPAAPNMDEGE